jgi:flagellin
MRIRNNFAALDSLRQAQTRNKAVAGNIEKLSSGQAINRGADGPALLVGANSMQSTAVGQLQGQKNAETAITLLQIAEGSLGEISGILTEMKQLSVHAANESVNDDSMLEADQLEFEHMLNAIDSIIDETLFNGRNLLDGSFGISGTTVGDNLRFVRAESNTPSSPSEGFPIDIIQVPKQAYVEAPEPLVLDHIRQPLQLTFNIGGRALQYSTESGEISKILAELVENAEKYPERFPVERLNQDVREQLNTSLNQFFDKANFPVESSITHEGKLKFTHHEYGSDVYFTITSNVAGAITKQAGVAENCVPGQDVQGTIAGSDGTGVGRFLTARPGSPAQGSVIEFTGQPALVEEPVLDEAGRQVGVTYRLQNDEEFVGSYDNPVIEGYLHISQQTRDIQYGGQSDETLQFSIPSVRTNYLGKGVENDSQFFSLADVDLRSAEGASDAINIVEKAIEDISSTRAELGAFQRNSVEKHSVAAAVNGDANAESESMFRDTDVAVEAAEMAKNQIMLNASQSMLAQANQKPRAVLSLLE